MTKRVEPSASPRQSRWKAYFLALLVTGAVAALRIGLAGWFGDRPVLLLFVLPIFLSSYLGGVGPGLVATAVAALGTSYFLIPPLGRFEVGSSIDTWDWLILIVVGVLISTLTEARRQEIQRQEATARRRGNVLPERKVQVGFALALACLGVVGVMSFTSVTRLSEEADHTRHTEELIGALHLLLSSATEVESAQRGYAITGNTSFLEPYADARSRIADELERLRKLTADNVEQQRRLSQLVPLVAARMADAAENVELRRSQGFSAAQEATASGRGKMLRDRVRIAVAEMEATARALLSARAWTARHSVTLARTVISGGSALAFGCVAVALLMIGRDFAGGRRADAALLEANEQLEARVQERTSALERSEARLGGIVGSAMDAIISVNREQRIVLFNTAAEKLFGCPASVAVGQALDQFIPPRLREHHRQHVEDFGRTGVTSRSMRTLSVLSALRADGVEFPIEASISQVEVAGEKLFTVVLRDITERKNAEARAVWLASFPERNPSPIVEVEPASGLVHYANPAALQQFPDLQVEGLSHPLLAGLQAVAAELTERGTLHRELTVGASFFSQLLTYIADLRRVRIYSTDITQRKSAEEALRGREAELHAADGRLAEIVQGMTEGCFALDSEWRFSFVNERAATLLHHEREQMLGRTIWEVFPSVTGSAFEDNYRHVMRERVPLALEVYSPIADRWLDIRMFPSGEGVAVFLLDVHDRKMAELEREKFVSLAENSLEFIGMRNLDGLPIFVNQAALRMVGLDNLEQALKTTPADFFFPEDQAFIRDEFVPRVHRDGHAEAEIRFRHFKTGEAIWMIYNAFVVRDSHGKPSVLATVSRNITDRKRAEQEVKQLNANLERRVIERTDQLEAANKELEAFSYSVSHDLRAPLRAVSGFSQIMLEDFGPQLPEEAKRHLHTIREGAQRMGMLIDDLLSFARLSRLPLKKRTVDTQQLVGEALTELKAEYSERTLEIQLADLPACEADLALLKQVWVNLLSNAFKYTSRRERGVIEIGATREQGATVYFVRDNGTGFDMQYAAKLFGVFQRFHRQEDFAGTGVGLAIVQRIVKRHGGRIWADAAADRGATFYFTLSGDSE
jgi:PAS domain S-box-containing protein